MLEDVGGWKRSAWTTRGLNLLLTAQEDTATYLETELCLSFAADLAILLENSDIPDYLLWCLKKEDIFFKKNWYVTPNSKALLPTRN